MLFLQSASAIFMTVNPAGGKSLPLHHLGLRPETNAGYFMGTLSTLPFHRGAMNTAPAYADLCRRAREAALLDSTRNVLFWDMQTMMPPHGQALRTEQMALLAAEIHALRTDPAIGGLLEAVEAGPLVDDPLAPEAVNIRQWRKEFDRLTRIPADLQVALSRAATEGRAIWERARATGDWSLFAPQLTEMLSLRRQEAEAVGYAGEPYDALLDQYEPGMTVAVLSPLLEDLAAGLAPLAAETVDLPGASPDILARPVPPGRLEAFSRRVIADLGYDFNSGRLDASAHPFSMDIGPGDVRITSTLGHTSFGSCFFGCVHETGHALYSSGLPTAHWGEPMGTALSMGLHESQSRLWENWIARSPGFWKHYYAPLLETVGVFEDVDRADFHRALTSVRPGCIRIQADEMTYNLHVVLRFELERAMLRRELTVADIPAAWRERMKALLGVTVPDDASGPLQDIHWALGYIGYFPTYALGNIYAAQLFATVGQVFPDTEERFARGEFAFLLDWLRQNIHAQGGRYPAAALIERVTNKPPSATDLLHHLQKRYVRK